MHKKHIKSKESISRIFFWNVLYSEGGTGENRSDSFHLMDIFIVFSGLAHSSIHQLGHTESLVVCLPLLLSYYVFTRS